MAGKPNKKKEKKQEKPVENKPTETPAEAKTETAVAVAEPEPEVDKGPMPNFFNGTDGTAVSTTVGELNKRAADWLEEIRKWKSIGRKTVKWTDEMKTNLSEKLKLHYKDKPGPMTGKKLSEESRQKLRDSHAKRKDRLAELERKAGLFDAQEAAKKG